MKILDPTDERVPAVRRSLAARPEGVTGTAGTA